MDHYLNDETWNALVDRLTGPHDPQAPGWTKRDEVVAALMEANVWPARIAEGGGINGPANRCARADN